MKQADVARKAMARGVLIVCVAAMAQAALSRTLDHTSEVGQDGARSGAAINPQMAPPRAGAPPSVIVDGIEFESWTAYVTSDYFQRSGKRCGTIMEPEGAAGNDGGIAGGSFADCNASTTNPLVSYAPTSIRYRIPVVFHVIRNAAGSQGNLSVAQIQAQINVLNEDYRALSGTPGALGFNCEIEFFLTPDYGTTPGTGVIYYNNDAWYNNSNTGYLANGKDPLNYLNVYTNTASGFLGYSSVPWSGAFGTNSDCVVLHWQAVGDPCPLGGGPYCTGRTATHEIGHYLGLYHTFDNGCGTVAMPGCYTTGDRVCDTNATNTGGTFGCPSPPNTCGDGPDNIRNYLDYVDDTCYTNFTSEQARRMRCVLEHRRTSLPVIVPIGCPASAPTFGGNFTTTPNLLYSDATVNGTTVYNPASCQPGLSDGAGQGAFTYAGSSFTHVGNEVGYKILHAGGDLRVSLSGLSTNLDLMLLGAAGTPASRLQRSESEGTASESVLVAGATAGAYYAVVETRGAGNSGSPYSIRYGAPPVGLNLDVNVSAGAGTGPPAATFAGAAAQPGTWTAITDAAGSATLSTLGGFLTGMTVARSGGAGTFSQNNPNTSGNHELLLDDLYDTGPGVTYTFAHLPRGRYRVFTYAIAPDSSAFRTNVSVAGSSSPNPQNIGGAIPVNSFTQGVTHAVHDVVVAPGANVAVTGAVATTAGSINGIQIVPRAPCPGDINGDGAADVNDLLLLIGAWGMCIDCIPDLNGDNVIDVNDLLLLIGGWGLCP